MDENSCIDPESGPPCIVGAACNCMGGDQGHVRPRDQDYNDRHGHEPENIGVEEHQWSLDVCDDAGGVGRLPAPAAVILTAAGGPARRRGSLASSPRKHCDISRPHRRVTPCSHEGRRAKGVVRRLGRLFATAGKDWLDDKAPRLAAALSYYTALSLPDPRRSAG